MRHGALPSPTRRRGSMNRLGLGNQCWRRRRRRARRRTGRKGRERKRRKGRGTDEGDPRLPAQGPVYLHTQV